MEKIITTVRNGFAFIAVIFLFQSCLKDSATRTYTIYSPVYKSVAEVRAGIKNDVPQPVVKPGKIVVLGKYIFLNEIDKGVHVIDNTNPSAPVNKYFIAIPGNLDLAVKGNTLYADLYRDLITIDIGNPAAVEVKKISKNVFPARRYSTFFIQDTSNIIVDWTQKDTIVAANDRSNLYIDFRVFSSSSVAMSSAAAPPKA